MKSAFMTTAAMLAISATSQAGNPFKCHIVSSDKSVDAWVDSLPLKGHGLDHILNYSFSLSGTRYALDAQATLFDDHVGIRVDSPGFFASSTQSLSVGKVGGESVAFDCKRVQ